MKQINVGSDFSGVGAFDFAIGRIASSKGFKVNTIFACDMDKYARTTYIHNHGEPSYFPENVYNRTIPDQPLDFYMTSPPCQSFSKAGARLGKDDKRGILFFNSLEFITKNQPRFFIFENVRGLMSDDNGRTFSEWLNLLGGKSVNGLPVLFPYENAVNYHIYHDVLNAKQHGIPQNRERVFIIGIRDDIDNDFRFPIQEHLTKRLIDILESDVDSKYYLSKKIIDGFMAHNDNHEKKGTVFIFKPKTDDEIANCLRANAAICPTDNTIKIKTNNALGYEIATHGDVVCYENLNSKTRRGRVGNQVAQTLDTQAQQAVLLYENKRLNATLQKHDLTEGEPMAIDVYNQSINKNCPTLVEPHHNAVRLWDGYAIRRLTPRECFRLMDFPDSFDFSVVSDTQAYKQAGNSIVVRVLEKIIANLPL